MSGRSTVVCCIAPHLLAVLPLQVEVVCGVHASVHALLVPGDPALHLGPLGGGAQGELLQVVHVDGGLANGGCGRGGGVLEERTRAAQSDEVRMGWRLSHHIHTQSTGKGKAGEG